MVTYGLENLAQWIWAFYKKVITMSFIPKKCRSCHSDCVFGA